MLQKIISSGKSIQKIIAPTLFGGANVVILLADMRSGRIKDCNIIRSLRFLAREATTTHFLVYRLMM